MNWGTAASLLPCLCRQAHAIVVTFAVNQTETLNHVSEVWMPRLQQLGVTVPVILAGLKCDILREEDHLHQVCETSRDTSGQCDHLEWADTVCTVQWQLQSASASLLP